jgi:hypothetical protein
MTSQRDQQYDNAHETEDNQPTLYESFIWNIVNDEATQISEQLRANLKTHLIVCGSEAAWEAALKSYNKELDVLGDEAYESRLKQVIADILEEAENALFDLSEEEYQEIERFESEKQLEALRKDMLTTREIDSAIRDFGEFNYLEARPDVERLLTSSHPELRARALEVLIPYWGLFSDYRESAFQFLTDPDPACRQQGLLCLNPEGKVLDDLPILQAYARMMTNSAELTSVRLSAYGELLTATGSSLSYDSWGLIHSYLEDGGTLEQAPCIDWSLVRFLSAESNQFQTTLSFETYKDWQAWVDQNENAFHEADELTRHIFLRAHHLACLRFSEYQMTITLQPKKKES